MRILRGEDTADGHAWLLLTGYARYVCCDAWLSKDEDARPVIRNVSHRIKTACRGARVIIRTHFPDPQGNGNRELRTFKGSFSLG